jgi:hypothetical protein
MKLHMRRYRIHVMCRTRRLLSGYKIGKGETPGTYIIT